MSGAERGRFLDGSTMGHVVRMTATGAFGITFVFLVDVVNLFWLSTLGDPQLVAAIGFAYAIQFFSVSSGIGLMIAGTALIARAIGEGKRPLARSRAGAALLISVVTQGFMASLVFTFRHELISMSGATGETAALAVRYLGQTIFSLVPMAVALLCSGALRADGFGAKAMYVTLISGVFLLILDPIFIIWLDMRLDGAALGLVIFRFFLMGFGVYYAIVQQKLIARPNRACLEETLRPFLWLAIPAILTQLATPAGNYLLTIVMAPYGEEAISGWTVVGRLTVLVFGGIFALSGAVGGIFGQNYGAGYMDRVRATYRDALIFCLIYTLVAWAILIGAGGLVAEFFSLSGKGAEVLHAFTIWGVGGFMFIGALFVSNAAFNNLGKPMWSTAANWTLHGALSWPIASAIAASLGAVGVIYGQALAGMITGTLAAAWGWRYVQTLQPDSATPARPRPYPNPDRYRSR